ncbi:MAG: hypothetical protein U9Q58_01860, partial [Pseudomonadota bacterium]|nr:hypothetical protein [Pseudomonadota bacterium]
YLQESQEKEGFALYLVKELGPKKILIETLWDFIRKPEQSLVVNEVLSEVSLLILDGLTEASFALVGDLEKLNLPEGEIDEGALIERGVTRNWSRKTLPENILFRYGDPVGGKRNLLLALEPPPELPKKTDEKKK